MLTSLRVLPVSVHGDHGPTGPVGAGQAAVCRCSFSHVCEPTCVGGHAVDAATHCTWVAGAHAVAQRLWVVVLSAYVAEPTGSGHVHVRVVVSVTPFAVYGDWLSICPGGHARALVDTLGAGATHAGAHAYAGNHDVLDTVGGELNGPMGVVHVCEVVTVCCCGPVCWYCADPAVVMRSLAPRHVYARVGVA